LNWIQIGLEFRRDLKIKKAFSCFYLAMGRIRPAGPAEPTQPGFTLESAQPTYSAITVRVAQLSPANGPWVK
jgi:hypothetical protein